MTSTGQIESGRSRVLAAFVLILLLMLCWRLFDFIDELVVGSVKMTVGTLVFKGPAAAIAQLVIVSLLSFCLIKAVIVWRSAKRVYR